MVRVRPGSGSKIAVVSLIAVVSVLGLDCLSGCAVTPHPGPDPHHVSAPQPDLEFRYELTGSERPVEGQT